MKPLADLLGEAPLREIGDPVLRQPARPVEVFDERVLGIARLLLRRLDRDASGAGLAAPQLGFLQRVFAHDLPYRGSVLGRGALVNPQILGADGSTVYEEGCLSVPGLWLPVERPARIHLVATTIEGKAIDMDLDGIDARLVLHEVDHLDGVLMVDRVSPEELRRIMIESDARATRRSLVGQLF